jgi:hypothetical protein
LTISGGWPVWALLIDHRSPASSAALSKINEM